MGSNSDVLQQVNSSSNDGTTTIPWNTIWQFKSNKLLIHTTTWMNFQEIMLSEEKPIQKCYILNGSIYMTFLNDKIIQMENTVVAKVCGREVDVAIKGPHEWPSQIRKCSVSWQNCFNVSISLWYCTIVLQDVTIGENRVRDTQDHSVLFSVAVSESTMISNAMFS